MIYTSATRALWAKPSRRYVSAENVFFSRWWNQQSIEVQTKVQEMVASGRFQFVGGGWVQNDEAVTHYTAIIDQMTLGLRFLNDTFGPDCGVPSVAWQADPFGHSIAQAALFARMGFSSAMIGRVSWETKAKWQKARTMEFVWETDSSQQGKCLLCSTVKLSPNTLVDYAKSQAKVYTNDTVAVMSGCDMCFMEAHKRFNRQEEEVISASVASLLNLAASDAEDSARQLHFCHLLNQSECSYTETQREFSVIVYNPASVRVSPYVRLPLGSSDRSGISVIGPDGARLQNQVLPLASHGHGIPESLSHARTSLVFRANIEPLGATLYNVNYDTPDQAPTPEPYFVLPDFRSSFIENERYRVELDPRTGLISAVILKGKGLAVQLRQALAAYLIEERALPYQQRPGHYVFTGYSDAHEIRTPPNVSFVNGPLVQEIHQTFTNYVSQVITLHRDSPFIEFTWTVGPLTQLMQDMGGGNLSGCDVISKFESNLESDGFYTDSNGWKNIHRKLIFQDGNLPIPGNYHPVVSWIYIEDRAKNLQMMILPDRSQGGTSMRNGHLELMLHRRHSTNDYLGLPETIEEDGVDGEGVVARGTHRLFLGTPSEGRDLMRLQALQLVYRPVILVSPGEWVPKKETFSALRTPLPSTVHVLTLERLGGLQVLLRLEHLAVTENTVEVNITRLLAGYRLEDVKAVTLGANQYLPGPTCHQWPTPGAHYAHGRVPDLKISTPQTHISTQTGDTVVKLSPREIASFLALLVPE
ncbi:lysosomal alpha-mannosidase-like [Rhipicephalus sanguineus]|uniref:lysosomal alpha-mannosidase-like n=1 Tax=Rhipicephalus sanguineus TaxID=34632 RepID=UPI0020C503BA|nr:lysosomal alpha-mannosidase-like [Rhipicephalus sanguineus]